VTNSAMGSSGGPSTPGAAQPGYTDHKQDLLARLGKIEGQVRGMTRMIEADRYCLDVLTQIAAVIRALQQVALGLLDDHIRHCLLTAVHADPAQATAKLDELAVALRRTLRL
jgi:DNA-binding FrmR family transcriptional regulator